MSKFSVLFEDNTLEGLQRQIVDYLCQFAGFGITPQGVSANDNGGEDQIPGESAFGDDKSEADG